MFCVEDYKTINGQEQYDQIRYEDYKVDLKKFIDPKSNKIKFKLNAILKLLPYNGFYPQQRTTQIANIFNKVFLDSELIVRNNDRIKSCYGSEGELSEGTQGLYKTLALTQCFFSPGILFNTIKSGIAVDWPTYITTSNAPLEQIYQRSGDADNGYIYSIANISDRVPFESILEPHSYFKYLKGKYNKSGIDSPSLLYLDPTHITFLSYYNNYYPTITPSIRLEELTTKRPKNETIYKSAINNFLYETVSFFLKNKQLSWFSSKEYGLDKSIEAEVGKAYVMDIIIRKSENFSMFNKINYSGSDVYIPSASLFGPPVNTNIFRADHTDNNCYLPYTPPYLRNNNESRITIKYIHEDSTKGYTTLQEMVNKLNFENDESYSNNTEDIAECNRMTLQNCLNLNLIENIDGKLRWYIQTKFETPLINFSKCSYVEQFNLNASLKEYPAS